MAWGRKPSCECGACKKCRHRAYMRSYYRSKAPEVRAAMIAGRDKERIRRQDRERHERKKNDPQYQRRRRAVAAVNRAIKRGDMVRGECEGCGTDVKVQGHHEDYDRPLDVRWLCAPCHAKEHYEC